MPELTPEEIIRNTIAAANRTTTATDTDLTAAVKRLRDGYGKGGGGIVSLTVNANYQITQGTYDGIDTLTFIYTGTATVSSFSGVLGIRKIAVNNPQRSSAANLFFCGSPDTSLQEIELLASLSNCANFQNAFYNRKGLKVVTGNPIDMSASTNNYYAFGGCTSLKEVRFVPSTIQLDCSNAGTFPMFRDCASLSDDSLISIANGLNANTTDVHGGTLTLHATPKARCSTLMGTVSSGAFAKDASGTVSLVNFITNTKGWTLA